MPLRTPAAKYLNQRLLGKPLFTATMRTIKALRHSELLLPKGNTHQHPN